MSVSGEGSAYFGWAGIRPDSDGIPESIKWLEQWVVWRDEPKPTGAGRNKIPYQARNGRKASSTDPSTWCSYDEAIKAVEEDPSLSGVGFCIPEESGVVGGDLDHCIDAETGELTELAKRIVTGIGGYWEITPSGTGLRFLGYASGVRSFKGNGIEVYTSGRYLTITGRKLPESTDDLSTISEHAMRRLREIATGSKKNGTESHHDSDIEHSTHPIVLALQEAGIYRKALRDGRHQITCPWVDEHTGADDSGTVFMEENYLGYSQARFVCQHTHCAHRRLSDLEQWLAAQGVAPVEAEEPQEYPLIWLADAKHRLDTKTVIRGLLRPESMVVTYGESNSGKTFNVLDRDISLAAGIPWHDRETEPGLVVYIAAEGAHSVEIRAATYRANYLQGHSDVPFAILPYPVDLLRPEADTDKIISFIKRIEDARGIGCVKVTADTLARVIAGGNENSPEDMGALVRSADKIRHSLGCIFEAVHHSGKDTAKGARGHSSLRAATDTEIEVTSKDGLHVAEVTKQRDLQVGDRFAFRLSVVEIGEDRYGHPITTCIPVRVDAPDKSKTDLSHPEYIVLGVLKQTLSRDMKLPPMSCFKAPKCRPKHGQTACPEGVLRTEVLAHGGVSDSDNPDSQARAYRRALHRLRDREIIGLYEGWVWLSGQPDKTGQ